MLAQLVAEPSVSSTSPDIDRSNLRVIEHLANGLIREHTLLGSGARRLLTSRPAIIEEGNAAHTR